MRAFVIAVILALASSAGARAEEEWVTRTFAGNAIMIDFPESWTVNCHEESLLIVAKPPGDGISNIMFVPPNPKNGDDFAFKAGYYLQAMLLTIKYARDGEWGDVEISADEEISLGEHEGVKAYYRFPKDEDPVLGGVIYSVGAGDFGIAIFSVSPYETTGDFLDIAEKIIQTYEVDEEALEARRDSLTIAADGWDEQIEKDIDEIVKELREKQ